MSFSKKLKNSRAALSQQVKGEPSGFQVNPHFLAKQLTACHYPLPPNSSTWVKQALSQPQRHLFACFTVKLRGTGLKALGEKKRESGREGLNSETLRKRLFYKKFGTGTRGQGERKQMMKSEGPLLTALSACTQLVPPSTSAHGVALLIQQRICCCCFPLCPDGAELSSNDIHCSIYTKHPSLSSVRKTSRLNKNTSMQLVPYKLTPGVLHKWVSITCSFYNSVSMILSYIIKYFFVKSRKQR